MRIIRGLIKWSISTGMLTWYVPPHSFSKKTSSQSWLTCRISTVLFLISVTTTLIWNTVSSPHIRLHSMRVLYLLAMGSFMFVGDVRHLCSSKEFFMVIDHIFQSIQMQCLRSTFPRSRYDTTGNCLYPIMFEGWTLVCDIRRWLKHQSHSLLFTWAQPPRSSQAVSTHNWWESNDDDDFAFLLRTMLIFGDNKVSRSA